MTQETSQALAAKLRLSLECLMPALSSPEQKGELEACLQQLDSMEEAIRVDQAAIQQASDARAKFVSVVTHELRIPMTSIKGYTDLMRSGVVGPINEQQRSFLNVIRNNVERMSALVSDLADINHIETNKLKLDLKPVSLADCVEEVVQALKPRLDDKGQKLLCEVPADLVKVIADRSRVIQILAYLVGNASKYTSDGGQVQVRARQQGDLVLVEVNDTGIGISAAEQAQIFNAFFRSENAAVRDQPGWGLSLHVARSLVELMGGQIGFKSAVKEGSSFWFSLPIYSQALNLQPGRI